MFENLPDFPNNRQSLLQSLRKNAVSIGDYEAEKEIVLKEIEAKKEHLRLARKRLTPYYKSKFSGWQKRSTVYLKSAGLWLENIFWGHGEKLIRFPLFLVGLSALLTVTHLSSLTELWAATGGEITKTGFETFKELLLRLINIEIANPTDFNLAIMIPLEIAKYLI